MFIGIRSYNPFFNYVNLWTHPYTIETIHRIATYIHVYVRSLFNVDVVSEITQNKSKATRVLLKSILPFIRFY